MDPSIAQRLAQALLSGPTPPTSPSPQDAAAQLSSQRNNFDPLNFMMGLGGAPGGYGAAFFGPGARGAYSALSDSILGFPKGRPPTSYEAQNFPHEQNVYIKLMNGDAFTDTIKGLNQSHAIERAYRNWPTASYIVPIP